MLENDDGESADVVYIHNATNRQVGCYTQADSNLHGHRLAIFRGASCVLCTKFVQERTQPT